jgi:hypothetical protein
MVSAHNTLLPGYVLPLPGAVSSSRRGGCEMERGSEVSLS